MTTWSLPNPIESTALARPDHAVIIDGASCLSAIALRRAVTERAAALHAQGIGPGVRVVLVAPPSVDWIVTWHALGWLGSIAVVVSPEASALELRGCLRAAEPVAVLCEPELAADVEAENLTAMSLDGHPHGTHAAARVDPSPEPPPERFWPLEEVRAVIFSSGTTGAPHAVELTTAQLLFSAFGSSIRLGHDPGDRWLACLPLFHVGGLSVLVRCAWLGTTVVLHKRFDPLRVARALDSGEVTLVSLVPTMLRAVLDARPAMPFPETLRAVLVGGAPIDAELLERSRRLGVPLALTWGMSEAASQVATRFAGDLSPDGGSGPPLAFARVDDAGAGRLVVRGPLVGPEHVLTSSDVGHVDEVGRVHVAGRADDVIISGGEKIAPSEVESVLRAHPWVEDVAVVGRAHTHWGERPVAFVVVAAGAEGAPETLTHTLRSWCRQHLVGFKTPDAVVTCEALPRTALGKLARGKLREQASLIDMSALDEAVVSASHLQRPARGADEVAEQLESTARRRDVPTVAERVADIRQWLAEDFAALEAEIRRATRPVASQFDPPGTPAEPDLAVRAADHLLARPGKWVRPICVLLAGRLREDPPPPDRLAVLRRLAVAAELVHNATLLHDDVIDLGDQRRGAPTARVVFGNAVSVLAGDHLLIAALDLVRHAGAPELLDELFGVIREMIAAEAIQLEQQQRFEARPDVYLRIAHGKTAALFRWALRAGARVGQLSAHEIDALGAAGVRLGVAFQLVDDVLDLEGDAETLGKLPVADLREGKLTWPLIVAAQRAPGLLESLRKVAVEPEPAQLAAVVRRVVETGAPAATRAEAQRHLQAALRHLHTVPESRPRRALEAVVDMLATRIH